MNGNELTATIIGAAIEVHRVLGPGLLESAYNECLQHELELRGVRYEVEVPVTVDYKGHVLLNAYRVDLLVENAVVVELKAVETLEPVHAAQLLTYLRLLRRRVGLLINFNVPVLRKGVRRIVNG